MSSPSSLSPSSPRSRLCRADVLSDVLFVLMHVAALLIFFVPFSWKVLLLAVVGYGLRTGAVTAGFHRYFAHRTYKTSRFAQLCLAVLGTTAMQNGPLWWARVRRALTAIPHVVSRSPPEADATP